MINRVMLEGEITRVDCRTLPSGLPVTSVSLLHIETWEKDGETKTRKSYFDVEAFGTEATKIADCFDKGDRVLVDGRLKRDSWKDQEDKWKHKIKIKADAMTRLYSEPAKAEPEPAPEPEGVRDEAVIDNDIPF